MRNYTTKKYEALVEKIDDQTFQDYMISEGNFIKDIKNIESRTLVDLGAGYGRILPIVAQLAKRIVAIEINPDMAKELKIRASKHKNITAIEGDFLKLEDLLPNDINQPIFLIALNTLGTIENGNWKNALDVVIKEAKKRNGELILSLLRQPVLQEWGTIFYDKIKEMSGDVDPDKSDFEKGIVITNTGYSSKWWTDKEIQAFKEMGKVIRQAQNETWQFLELSFP
jgi:SAM-dependent methyltransferase